MLPSWFKALFEQNAPGDLARSRLSQWQAWLEPIPGLSEVGSDPAYEDDFLLIKEEVAKFSGIDDALVITASERLLREHCKDLRPAAYYAFARLRQDGVAGLADGLELIAALIVRYPDHVLPHRPESRKAALEWLLSERVTAHIGQQLETSKPDIERACSALVLIEHLTEAWDEPGRPLLRPLLRHFEPLIEPPHQHAGAASLPSAADSSASSANPVPTAAGAEITSARELIEQARQMAVFMRRQPHGYLPAYRLVRCVRWDLVAELPPHDVRGLTRLAPPRAELRQQLKRLVLQQQWHELIERVETAFLEGANHFWLDLQYFAWLAQGQAGAPYGGWRDLLLTDFAQMRDRLDGLERLAFSDGSPFAEDATLEWIARYAIVRDIEAGEAILPLPVDAGGEHWRETEAQASELAASSGLEAAFGWLCDLPAVAGERHRLLRQLLMARLAEANARPDVALHLLATLDLDVDAYCLDRWEPELAFAIKAQQLRLLRQKLLRKDVDRPGVLAHIERLMPQLARLDPARTLALGS
ncbi:type VI secretion system protein TssA [Andreprevotia chitinilytica]|uniref:type VI secretion system protein TssA n=1 Tax=Andreprevotia chitinilytica TaxID=396808 RepID=UPI00068BA41B|nr:type VI secretion system protein TssA [Andreprevotia chitinilytica]